MNIILSIKPKWAQKIYSGKKTIEWRKTEPRIYFPGQKVYIYETAPVCKVTGFFLYEHAFKADLTGRDMFCEIVRINVPELIEYGCVNEEDLIEYQGGSKFIFGWVCRTRAKLKNPMSLAEFGLKRPPQSWQYLKK